VYAPAFIDNDVVF